MESGQPDPASAIIGKKHRKHTVGGERNPASGHRAARPQLGKQYRMSEAGKIRENSGSTVQGRSRQRVHVEFGHRGCEGLRGQAPPTWPA